MPVTVTRGDPRDRSIRNGDLRKEHVGHLFLDDDGDLFTVAEDAECGLHRPIFVDPDGLIALNYTVSWPLMPAPSGTSVTISN